MNITISVAQKDDKNSIKRFYKSNHYSASFMGGDTCFIARLDNEIVGGVIISHDTRIDSLPFLHALVVNKQQRGSGIARNLLNEAQRHFNTIVCFADNSLQSFYFKRGFNQTTKNALPTGLTERFIRYQCKNPNLGIFIYAN